MPKWWAGFWPGRTSEGLHVSAGAATEGRGEERRGAAAEGARSSSDDESDAGLAKGDRVEAQYKGRVGGKWYPGKIARVNSDGTFDIAYDDGGKDSRLRARCVKREKKSSKRDDSAASEEDEDFQRGDRVSRRSLPGGRGVFSAC